MSACEDDLARILAYLELIVTRRLNGPLRGSFLSTTTGEGSESVGSHEYVTGDDARQVDWAVAVRTGVPHVCTSEAERELECWIVVEPAACLSTGLADTTKRHLLTATIGAVAMLNDAPGSRTGSIAGGILVSTDQNRAYGLILLKQLADATAEHNLAADIDMVMTQALRVGLLVVIPDFLGSLDWARPLYVVSASIEIMAVCLADPTDEALPGEGSVIMTDSATSEATELNINDRTRTWYVAQASAHHEHIVNELRKYRARVITLRMDFDQILDFVRQIGQHQRLSNRLSVPLLGHRLVGYNH